MTKIIAYAHGKDLEDISFINLIILNDSETIGVFEFNNDSFIVNVYDNSKLETINNILFQIFGRYLNIKVNNFEIKGNFLPMITKYINNQGIECNFMELEIKNKKI